MIQFANPFFKYLLILPVVITILYFFYIKWVNKKLILIDNSLIKKILPFHSKLKIKLKFFIYVIILTLTVIGLMDPKFGSQLKVLKKESADIVFALDISKSMLAQDIYPDRLTKAKQIILNTIDELSNDRIGIIIYASNSYPQLPLTNDYAAAKMFVKNINTDLIPSQGTDIQSAIDLSIKYFENSSEVNNKVLFILSDGEDHEGNYNFSSINDNKILINTIGIGSVEGSPIPTYKNGKINGYKKDINGNVIVSKMDPNFLKKIAFNSNGNFTNNLNNKEVIKFITESINSLDKVESESEFYSEYEHKFQFFLLLSFFLIIFEIILPNKKSKNLFKYYDEK